MTNKGNRLRSALQLDTCSDEGVCLAACRADRDCDDQQNPFDGGGFVCL